MKTPEPLVAYLAADILSSVLWAEYEIAAEEAREAYRMGDKLKALALAIWAHKMEDQYNRQRDKMLFIDGGVN